MRTARTSLLLAALLVTGACGGSSSATPPPPPPPCLCGGTCATDGSCVACDAGLTLNSANPTDAANALGICRNLVTARWVQPDGAAPPTPTGAFDVGHGLLASFGPNVTPREGARLLALSSGTARAANDPDYVASITGFAKGYVSGLPPGFPMAAPVCPGQFLSTGNDGVGLEVTLTVPTGATGLAIDYKFYSSDWPDFVCSNFNDQFIIRMSPQPATEPTGNLAHDPQGNPVGPYPSFIDECSCTGPCTQGGLSFTCALGTAGLVGTGFEAGAASSWRTATAPAHAGDTVSLRFAIWDSGDGQYDSTVLLDHFRWTN